MNNNKALQDSIIASLNRIVRIINRRLQDLLKDFDLTEPQLRTLQELARLSPVPVGALATAVGVSQSTMTGILDRLEKRVLVTRTKDENDRRTVTIEITSEGTELLKRAPQPLEERFRQRLANLKESEQRSIAKALRKIEELIEHED